MNQTSLFPLAGNHPAWTVPPNWSRVLADRCSSKSRQKLMEFVSQERCEHEVFPHEEDVFRAFQLTSPENVRFVILGQDPYHGPGQAHGLSFSVRDGIKIPPSLANIFKELQSDIGCPVPESGNLTPWARQGGLLLNTVLTVRSGEAHSHRRKGWEQFTDAVIQQISGSGRPVAFVLWGKPAQKKRSVINDSGHLIIEAPHPSPLSAHRGFFGSKPFSKINRFLDSHGLPEIDWSLNL